MAGYSEKPLLKKLGIAPGARMLVRKEPDGYWDWISPLPEGVEVKSRAAGTLDFVHLFVTTAAFKKEALQLRKLLEQNGVIWMVSWTLKSAPSTRRGPG